MAGRGTFELRDVAGQLPAPNTFDPEDEKTWVEAWVKVRVRGRYIDAEGRKGCHCRFTPPSPPFSFFERGVAEVDADGRPLVIVLSRDEPDPMAAIAAAMAALKPS